MERMPVVWGGEKGYDMVKKKKKTKDREVMGSQHPGVLLCIYLHRFLKFPAQLSPIPLCMLPTSTRIHITGTRTPFLPLQHLLPLSFIFCSKLPAVTSGLWGQLPNPASPLARYAGLVPLTPCSVGPEESGVGDTWGQLRVPVLPGHLGQATYLQWEFVSSLTPSWRVCEDKIRIFFCLNTI